MRTHYHTLEQGILLLVVGDVRLAGPADVGGVPADAHRQSDVGRICPRLRLTRRYHRLKIRRFFVIIVINSVCWPDYSLLSVLLSSKN